MSKLIEDMKKANAMCSCNFNDVIINRYDDIYAFTTENINGYIDNFELNNKSLLTVGSSGDQVLNANLRGCNNITLVDINPFIKYYMYLKISLIMVLDNIEDYYKFLTSLYYKNNHKELFNKDTFNKISDCLKSLDYESYLFWSTLLNNYDNYDIKNHMFMSDEYSFRTLTKINNYMTDIKQYKLLRSKLEQLQLQFINSNIDNINTNNTYDNIWLSNIAVFYGIDKLKPVIDNKLNNLLNPNGEMLISYIYDTYPGMKLGPNWNEIYDLNYDLELYKEYNPDICLFDGIDNKSINGFKQNCTDVILKYKKR